MSGSEAMAALADAWPADGIAVVETPPRAAGGAQPAAALEAGVSYYFGASGGLGFGISAAVGVQLAQPSRPVVCVLGEGSAQYGITALWTAVAYALPVTFLVLRNEEYMILKWFAALEQVEGAPGLDLPGLDTAAVARAYGMSAREVGEPRRADRRRCARRSRRTTGRGSSRCASRRECGWSEAGRGPPAPAPIGAGLCDSCRYRS